MVSNKKIFKGFSLKGSMYNVTPRARPILTPGYNLNNPGRGPLDKVVYQISKGWAFLFQTRRFFKVFPI